MSSDPLNTRETVEVTKEFEDMVFSADGFVVNAPPDTRAQGFRGSLSSAMKRVRSDWHN